MKSLCPCRDCRGPHLTLKQAMSRARRHAEMERFSPQELAVRDYNKRKRLEALRQKGGK